MKAVKINMSEGSASKPMKAIVAGVIVCVASILLCTVVIALFMNIAGVYSQNAAGFIMLVPLLFGGFTGGYTAARINKSSGMVMGIISTGIVLLAIIITGFIKGNSDITYMLLLKAIALLVTGAVGGVKGVNKKEKYKI